MFSKTVRINGIKNQGGTFPTYHMTNQEMFNSSRYLRMKHFSQLRNKRPQIYELL